ncbi:FAA hydrolase family protein [Paenibacillaceae bacterium]|nr:FAA hydrolase family protein [Paenibacillaceae bacterium]
MKLLNFIQDGQSRLGIRTEQGVIDVGAAASQLARTDVPATITDAIEGGETALSSLQALVDALPETGAFLLDEAGLQWGSCVTSPNKIICIGLNYRKHAEETNAPIPEYPIIFNKFNNTITSHQADIAVPKVTEKLDYEAELTIVIGKKAKDVSEEDALDYVFGYCNVNDLSARDLQLRTQQWLLGKTCDDFSPLGPYLVTKDEVGNPNELEIRAIVNGEVRQNSNTSDMIFSCAEIISYLSKHMTLVPGDIILTGTPEGVVLGYPPEKQVYLQPGDEVTIEIEKLGSLTNKFVAEA